MERYYGETGRVFPEGGQPRLKLGNGGNEDSPEELGDDGRLPCVRVCVARGQFWWNRSRRGVSRQQK